MTIILQGTFLQKESPRGYWKMTYFLPPFTMENTMKDFPETDTIDEQPIDADMTTVEVTDADVEAEIIKFTAAIDSQLAEVEKQLQQDEKTVGVMSEAA